MKIDDMLRAKLADAVGRYGGVKEFACRSKVDAANISRYLRGITRSIKDDNWEKLMPFLECGNENPVNSHGRNFIAATAELTAFISGRMKSCHINSVEKLRQRINFNSYETLRRQLNGNLNWQIDTLAEVFEVLGIAPESAPLDEPEQRWIVDALRHSRRGSMVRELPILTAAEDGKLFIDGSVVVPDDQAEDLRAFRVSDALMQPHFQPGDVVIAEVCGSLEDIPDKALVVIRFCDSVNSSGRILCRRFRKIHGYPPLLCCDDPTGELSPVLPETVQWCGVVRRRISEFL